ncbi:hypothetical protein ACLB2K_042954 [Fragaria x ananassa]
MALVNVAALQFTSSTLFKSRSAASTFLVLQTRTTGSNESEANCQNWKSKNSKQKNAEEGSFTPDACVRLESQCCNAFLSFHSFLVFVTMRFDSYGIMVALLLAQYNGTPAKPRLSVFCSDEQLYAILVDDQNNKFLFYGSTLQKSIRQDPHCSTAEAAKRVGEKLIKACDDLNVGEISSYDRNGFAIGKRIQAFENAISKYGILSR